MPSHFCRMFYVGLSCCIALHLRLISIHFGTIRILCKNIFRLFGPPAPLRKHVFCNENMQILSFSTPQRLPPSLPTMAYVIYEWSLIGCNCVVCVVCFSNHLFPKFRNPLFFTTHFSFQISGGKGHFQVYDSNEPVVAICQGCTGKEENDPATTTAATMTTTSGHSGLLFSFF